MLKVTVSIIRFYILLCVGLAFLLSSSLEAQEVYVSKKGSDSNPGTIDLPFFSIQKASNVLVSGGSIYIRGGVYRETVDVAYANQTFSNYNDEYVLLTGLDSLSGWTEYKDGIFQADFSGFQTEFTQLFAKGQYQQMARYPNNTTGKMMDISYASGFDVCDALLAEGSESTRRVYFPNMPVVPDNYWVGGYFRGITGLTWMNPHGTIVSSKGKDLEVNPVFGEWQNNNVNIEGGGEGFIFHLNALDYPGEWYAQNAKIYYMPPEGNRPEDLLIEAQRRKWAFRIRGKNNIKIKGLHIKAASLELRASNCEIDSCSFRYIFPYFTRRAYNAVFDQLGGIYVNGNSNVFSNCYLAKSWGNGFSIENGSGNRVENCIIEDVGWNAQFTSSILSHAPDTQIEHCTFGSTGRFHIRFQNKCNILYNDLYDCMKMGQDAGSIEATSGGAYDTELNVYGAEIAYNHIHDCSTISSYKSTKNFVVALYLEDVANYTAHHNVIWNIRTQYKQGAFVYLGPRRTTIWGVDYFNNTAWDCDKGIAIWNRENLGGIETTRFYNNLLDSRMEDGDDADKPLLPNIDFQNNIYSDNAEAFFEDRENAGFRLFENAAAIDSGLNIPGITEGYTASAPDVGAYEYGADDWTVGATIETPFFNEVLQIETLGLRPRSANLEIGDSLAFTIEFSAGIDPASLILNSGDTSIIRILEGMKVFALGSGSTQICVQTLDGRYSSSMEVVVQERLRLCVEQADILVGDTLDYVLEVSQGIDSASLLLTFNDTSVLRMDTDRRIIAKGMGAALLHVETPDQAYSDQIEIRVHDPLGRKIIAEPDTLSLFIGDTATLDVRLAAEVNPLIVSYASFEPLIATIDAKGQVVARDTGFTDVLAYFSPAYLNADTVHVIVKDSASVPINAALLHYLYKIYPNPAKEVLYFECEIAEAAVVEIFSLSGARLYKKEIKTGFLRIPLRELGNASCIFKYRSKDRIFCEVILIE